jgi:3-methyl-2-oxobutanoate hydroxymethyltransferase
MRVTIRDMRLMKRRGERIPMLTAYDYTSARLVEAAGVPVILVGDSLGQWLLGYETTLPVTMDDMVHHVKAVVRATKTAHVVADMPFMSYQADAADAVRNAGRMLQEGGAQSVKLEGGAAVAPTVRNLVAAGIPVMGHVGFTPQSYNQLGGYRVQGRFPKAAAALIDDAAALESAGCYSVVLEMVPAQLAALITERLSIPTIGIASGVHCDGQVQEK